MAAVENAKALVQEQLALLRLKLDQIPALQDVEVSESCITYQILYSISNHVSWTGHSYVDARITISEDIIFGHPIMIGSDGIVSWYSICPFLLTNDHDIFV